MEVIGWCFVFGIVDMFIVMSNIFVIVVFMWSKLLWKCINYFLLCLVIVDMMVGIILLLIFVYIFVFYIRGEELDSVWINVFYRLLDIFLGFVLIFVLIIIVLECLYLVVLLNWY